MEWRLCPGIQGNIGEGSWSLILEPGWERDRGLEEGVESVGEVEVRQGHGLLRWALD